MESESVAATHIQVRLPLVPLPTRPLMCCARNLQACFRGFTTRPHSDAVVGMKQAKKQILARGEASIETAMLKDLDNQLGLKPIPGVTLNPPKKKMSKKARRLAKKQKVAPLPMTALCPGPDHCACWSQEEEEKMSTRIQSIYRARTANGKTSVLRQEHDGRRRDDSARLIQRTYRGHLHRRFFQAKREKESITKLQSRYRMMKSQERVDKIKTEKVARKREDEAASRIQAKSRGMKVRSGPSPGDGAGAEQEFETS